MSSNDQKTQQSGYEHPHPNPEHATEPSGPKGDNSSTAGPGPINVQSNTPENRSGNINPSAPEDTNIALESWRKISLPHRRSAIGAP